MNSFRPVSPSFSGVSSPSKTSLIQKSQQQSRPYIVADLAGSLLFKKIGPRVLLPTVVIAWGIVATLQGKKLGGFYSSIFFCHQLCNHIAMLKFTVAPGFVTTYTGLVTLRAFLGLVEGPLSPGIFLLLSNFYTRKELSFRYVAGSLFRRRPSLH